MSYELNKLKGLEENAFFYFFEKISSIPRASYNMKEISDYIVSFAKERNLRYVQDKSNNVIIYKEAQNSKSDDAVIMQAHMDMVTLAKEDKKIDFTKEAISLKIDGDYIRADDTTLGGDDGVGMAYMLAILDDDKISHPPIEAVFTTDEEVGMLGASCLDYTLLTGKYMMNIDSEDEGQFISGCAGGATVTFSKKLIFTNKIGNAVEISVENCVGGHSGIEIINQSANAISLIGYILYELKKEIKNVNLVSISGGKKDNAIPTDAKAILLVDENVDLKIIDEKLKEIEERLTNSYTTTDKDILISHTFAKNLRFKCLDNKDSENIIKLLKLLPNGVVSMSKQFKNLVETSSNMGIIKMTNSNMSLTISARSNVDYKKEALLDDFIEIANYCDFTVEITGSYPAWEYEKASNLRSLLLEEYEKVTNKKGEVLQIHAGLEASSFVKNIENLDCVSFGPQVDDIHTPREKMSISSANEYYEIIKNVLQKMAIK